MPIVTWHRENGNLPEGRSRILLDNTLRIEDTRPEDQGRYICRGHNEGGNVTIAVKLYIYGKYSSKFNILLQKRLILKSPNCSVYLASPSFIEAPSDVEVNEGGSVKLPCRAQGRPKPRIIWDRIGGSAVSQTHPHQIGSKIPQYLEKDSQEDLLVKAKIMSLRLKRSIEHVQFEILPKVDNHTRNFAKSVYLKIERNIRNQRTHQAFDQIMRNEYDKEVQMLHRKKRQTENDGGKNEDGDGDNRSPDVIPILVFSTQAPPEVSRLQVTDNGELILLDVGERDQVSVCLPIGICETFVNRNHLALKGWYACAALNEAGSTVKRIFIRVLGGLSGRDNDGADAFGTLDRFSNEQNILINTVLATSPNSLDITWETTDGIPATSLTLHYRIVGSNEFQTATAMIDTKEYTINDLRAHAEYEVFASVPHGLSGSISNIRKGNTIKSG